MATKKKTFSSPSSGGSMLPWLGIAFIIVLLDQLSKIAILKVFHYREVMPITEWFNLTLHYNPGAAFSFLANAGGWQRHFFTAIGIGAALYIAYLLKRHSGQRLFCWALALILGGAIGNVIDRISYGHVVDFLDFHWRGASFPTFNLADTAICIGAALFVLDELRRVNK
ncbi:signal peptidase II [Pseudoduganella sp.]|uniref:signal peptidase II n=1 Tax=Pseudoduganella sp. TaxID=1880898 RepID=UPI0035B11B07